MNRRSQNILSLGRSGRSRATGSVFTRHRQQDQMSSRCLGRVAPWSVLGLRAGGDVCGEDDVGMGIQVLGGAVVARGGPLGWRVSGGDLDVAQVRAMPSSVVMKVCRGRSASASWSGGRRPRLGSRFSSAAVRGEAPPPLRVRRKGEPNDDLDERPSNSPLHPLCWCPQRATSGYRSPTGARSVSAGDALSCQNPTHIWSESGTATDNIVHFA